MIVPFSAGGPTDLMARIVGERMSKDSASSSSSTTSPAPRARSPWASSARSTPDGYTIGIGHLGTNVVQRRHLQEPELRPAERPRPIARLPSEPAAGRDLQPVPAKDLKELVAYLKANADKISGGTAGMGSGSHHRRARLLRRHRHQLPARALSRHRPGVQDLIANQIQIMIDQSSNSLPHVRAGKLKVYAVHRQGAHRGGARHSDHGRGRLPGSRSRSGTGCGRPRARRRRSSPS
jgi:tripartite-type tricarboxylate transporter receptor subunit TctC